MPVHSTNGAMSVNGWITLDTSNATPASTVYYFEAFDFRPNTASANSITQTFYATDNSVFLYGSNNAKSYTVGFAANGSINYTKTANATPTTFNPAGIAIDNNGAKHLLLVSNNLRKYDITDTEVLNKTLSTNVFGAIGRDLAISKDGYLYVLTGGTTSFALVKLDTSYNIQWSKAVTADTGVGSSNKIEFDNSGNIYVILDDYVFKFATDGSLVWQRKLSGSVYPLAQVSSVDTGGNVLVFSSTSYVKISSAGSKTFEKVANFSFSNGNACSTTINSTGDLVVLTSADSFGNGFRVMSFTTSDTPAFLGNTYYYDNTGTFNKWQTNRITSTNTNTFLSMKIDSTSSPGRFATATMRLPYDGNLISLNTSYSFSVTADNGTSYTYTGNILSQAGNSITFTNSSNLALTTPTFSVVNANANIANNINSYGALTPTEYILTLP